MLHEPTRRFRANTGLASEEIEAPPFLRGSFRKQPDEVGAGDAIRERRSLEPSSPEKRVTVGHADRSLFVEDAQLRIAYALQQQVRIGRDDPAARLCAERLEYPVHHLEATQRRKRDARQPNDPCAHGVAPACITRPRESPCADSERFSRRG
jgi:hypothetical protein